MSVDWRSTIEIVLAGGLVGVLANMWLNRRKPEVDRGTLELARSKNAADIYATDLAGLRDILAELRAEVKALNDKVGALERRLDDTTRERDRHRIERNDARDLARGLWGVAEGAGAHIPFPRPGWL